MSKLQNTQKRIASKKKNAKEYSLAWFVSDLFQQSKIQTGIKNAVRRIMINARPSIPSIILILMELNQELVSRNWNWVDVISKKKQ
jgi:hypothetical protein